MINWKALYKYHLAPLPPSLRKTPFKTMLPYTPKEKAGKKMYFIQSEDPKKFLLFMK